MTHTITLEIELDLDVPEGTPWTPEVKDGIEAGIDALLREHADGRALGGAGVRVEGHSVVAVPGAWPYR